MRHYFDKLFFQENEEFEIRNGVIVKNLNVIFATKLSGTQSLWVILYKEMV